MSAARNLAPMTAEERIARAIAAIRADLEPDPLFERRLRSQVLGRHVAAREGAVVPERARSAKEMGRLGRSVLYASFALGLSVTGVMAASQQATPGDVLYPLKREIEALRHRVLPQEFEAVLLRAELTARLDELAAVAERGDTAAVAGLAHEVHQSSGEVIELSADSPQNLIVLEALLERLPEPARTALQDVVVQVDRTIHPAPSRPGHEPGTRGGKPGASAAGGRGGVPPVKASPPAAPSPEETAAAAPSGAPGAAASSSAQPAASGRPGSSDKAAPSKDADSEGDTQGGDEDQ
jgi:hypothetical protein